MASESTAHSACGPAIDSEPIRARGRIVNDHNTFLNVKLYHYIKYEHCKIYVQESNITKKTFRRFAGFKVKSQLLV